MNVYLQLIDTAEDRSKFERLYEQYKQLINKILKWGHSASLQLK